MSALIARRIECGDQEALAPIEDVLSGLLSLATEVQEVETLPIRRLLGRVIAEDIVVRGRVVGSIRGLRVTLQAQSHVEGDIFHQSLAIEQGAYFEGKSRRSDNPLEEIKATSPGGSARPADKPSSFDAKPQEDASAISTRAAE